MFKILNAIVKKWSLLPKKVIVNLGETCEKGSEGVGVDLSA